MLDAVVDDECIINPLILYVPSYALLQLAQLCSHRKLTLNKTHSKFTRNKLPIWSDSNIQTSFYRFNVLSMCGIRTCTRQQTGTLMTHHTQVH